LVQPFGFTPRIWSCRGSIAVQARWVLTTVVQAACRHKSNLKIWNNGSIVNFDAT
jgi:hypothetical protein